MAEAKSKKSPARKVPKDLLAIDFGSSATKLLRFRNSGAGHRIIALDLLPPLSMIEPSSSPFPKSLMANYAAIAHSCESALVRMVGLPNQPESDVQMEKTLREHIGLDPSFRLAHFAPPVVKGRETRVLAVAMPESDLKPVLDRFSAGPPAPVSFELSGLAALNAAQTGPASEFSGEAIALMDCGSKISTMAVLNKGQLILARKLEVGGDSLIAQLAKQFSVDEETARSFVSEGAIDITASVRQVMEPFIRQLIISKDFVERQENCRISRVFMSGGMCLNRSWVSQIEQAVGLSVTLWDPLGPLLESPSVLPDRLRAESCRFAAAVGVGRGALESS